MAAWVDDLSQFTDPGDIGFVYVIRKNDGTWSFEEMWDSETLEVHPGICIPGSLAEQVESQGFETLSVKAPDVARS